MDTSLSPTLPTEQTDIALIIDANNLLSLTDNVSVTIPDLFVNAGDAAIFRFAEFFNAKQRNENTRMAYATALMKFCNWCESRGLQLSQVNPLLVGRYFDELQKEMAITSVKQHHSALSKFFDYLVMGHILPINPMYSVDAPKYRQDEGLTPVMSEAQARQLLDSIDVSKISGKRDKAILAMMLYRFARVSAVLNMKVEDYFFDGESMVVRLYEKRNNVSVKPLNSKAVKILNDYL